MTPLAEDHPRDIDESSDSDDISDNDDDDYTLRAHPFLQNGAAEGRTVKTTLPPKANNPTPARQNTKKLTVSEVGAYMVMRDQPTMNRYWSQQGWFFAIYIYI